MESKSVDSEAYTHSFYCRTVHIMWSMVDWIGSYSRVSEATTCALYVSLASALNQSAFASPILVHACLCTQNYAVTSSWILVLCFLFVHVLVQICLCIVWCGKMCHHILLYRYLCIIHLCTCTVKMYLCWCEYAGLLCVLTDVSSYFYFYWPLIYTFGRHFADRRCIS